MSKMVLTIRDIFNIPTAEIFNPDSFEDISCISTDTRNIIPESLFVAIKGNNFDGHNFINEAVKQKVNAVLINKSQIEMADNIDIPIITVDDTVKALGDIAKVWRKKLAAKVIGLTGSAGKTSTKEILYALLSVKFNVNKTTANNNNHIGVPLTVLSTSEKHNILIAELGTNHFGEIPYSAGIVMPDISIITNIGDSHLEFFKTRKGVLKEKKAIFDAAEANRGTIFINNDDKLLSPLSTGYSKVVTFGFADGSQIKGEIVDYSYEGKPVLNIQFKKQRFNINLPIYGEQSAINFLTAASIALYLGLTSEDIIKGAKKLKSVAGRLNVINLDNKILIDDTYNANPSSTAYSLSVLNRIKTYPRKIAVLGDMFELGEKAEILHKNLLKVIKKEKIGEVYTVGPLMKNLNEELKKAGSFKNRHFASRSTLKKFLENNDLTNSVILVKGSRGMKMEEFVNVIKEQ